VIAAINGPCAGMAVPIVAACDMRFASDRALFTVAFSQRGLIAEWGSAWLLPRLVGPAHALDLLMSSRKVDAQEAERIGLVNRVLPHDDLLSFVREYVEDLAAKCSPASMMVMKRQVWQQLTRTLGPSEKEAIQLMIESFSRPDFKEGVASFIQKRPPKFDRV
jgi:enoyl-CoA hydratase/carnithine racemase